jgi:hypothetical protein
MEPDRTVRRGRSLDDPVARQVLPRSYSPSPLTITAPARTVQLAPATAVRRARFDATRGFEEHRQPGDRVGPRRDRRAGMENPAVRVDREVREQHGRIRGQRRSSLEHLLDREIVEPQHLQPVLEGPERALQVGQPGQF